MIIEDLPDVLDMIADREANLRKAAQEEAERKAARDAKKFWKRKTAAQPQVSPAAPQATQIAGPIDPEPLQPATQLSEPQHLDALAEKQKIIDELSEQLAQAKIANHEIANPDNATAHDLLEVKETLKHTEAHLAVVMQARQKAETERDQARQLHNEVETALTAAQTEITRLQALFAESTPHQEQLEHDLAVERDKAEQVAQDLENLNQVNRELEKDLATTRNTVTGLRKSIGEYVTNDQRLKSEQQSLIEARNQALADCDILAEERDDIAAKLSQVSTLHTAEVEAHARTKEEYADRFKHIEAKRAALLSVHNETSKKLEEANRQIQEYRQKWHAAQQTATAQEAIIDQLQAAQRDQEGLEATIAHVTAEMEGARHATQEAIERAERAEATIGSQEQDLAALRAEIARLQILRTEQGHERDQLAGKLDAIVIEHGQVVAERDKAFAERAQAYADREQVAAELTQAIADREKTAIELEEITADRNQARVERDLAINNQETALMETEQLTQERDRVQADLEQMTLARDQVADAIAQLRAEHTQILADYEKAVQARDQVALERDKISGQLDHLQSQANQTAIELDKATKARDTALSEREKVTQERNRLTNDLSQVTGERDKALAEQLKLADALAQAQRINQASEQRLANRETSVERYLAEIEELDGKLLQAADEISAANLALEEANRRTQRADATAAQQRDLASRWQAELAQVREKVDADTASTQSAASMPASRLSRKFFALTASIALLAGAGVGVATHRIVQPDPVLAITGPDTETLEALAAAQQAADDALTASTNAETAAANAVQAASNATAAEAQKAAEEALAEAEAARAAKEQAVAELNRAKAATARDASLTAPNARPADNPTDRAEASFSATCTEEAAFTITATGGGQVNLTAGGQSASGNGSASISLTGTSVSGSANAEREVSINWSADSYGTCQ